MESWIFNLKEYLDDRELPIYLSLCKGIQEIIRNGMLNEGDQLPTVRGLAGILGINNGTVARAYQRLEQDGWLFSKTGRGTFVKLSSEIADSMRPKESAEQGFWADSVNEDGPAAGRKIINLAASTPSPDLFPVEYYKEAMNTVLDRDGGRAFGYHEGLGYYQLREAISGYLMGLGVHALPQTIQITTGAQQGVDLVGRALIHHGDVVYMERPSYTGAIGSFKSYGAILIDIPMDDEGIDLNSLENLVRKKQPRLVYVMPNYQSPTGLCYSEKRKSELLKLSEKYGFYILEDDYLGELSFDDTIKRPIKAMDNTGKVIYVKSFSKLFMPGVRLGFTVLPQELLEEAVKAKRYTDISTDGLTQRIFDLYLRSGRWQSYLETLRSVYSEKHNRLGHAMLEHKDIFYFSHPNGGLTYWVSFPHGRITANMLARAALDKGVRVLPGEPFYIHHKETNKLRLGYAAIENADIDTSVQILADLIRINNG